MVAARRLSIVGITGASLTAVRAQISWSNSITEDPANPTISDLGKSLATPSAGAAASMLSPEEQAAVTKESDEFVEAAIKSFLNKQHLPPQEMACIQQGSGQIAGNVGPVVEQMGMALGKAFGATMPGVPAQAAEKPPEAVAKAKAAAPLPAASPGTGAAGSAQVEAGKQTMSMFYGDGDGPQRRLSPAPAEEQGDVAMLGPEIVPMAMQIGITMKSVVNEMHELVGKCIHSDAKIAFEKAGDHALNMKYITGHFLANGADIVDELADSVMAYERRNATKFGADVGKALRKIFLSNSANGKLPEGLPGDAALANVTEGILLGFFGPGTYLDVHLKQDKKHPLHVDMQRCITKDVKYFQDIWMQTMYMFAQGASGVGRGGASSAAERMEFGAMLAFSLMELPAALGKCGVSAEQEAMLMDAVKSLGSGARAQVSLPSKQPSKDEMATTFASTLEEWSAHHWLEFGKKLGSLLQKSAITFYPKKFSLTSEGILRQQLSLRASGGPSSTAALLAVPLVLMVASMFVALRTLRATALVGETKEGSADAASQRGLLLAVGSTDLEEAAVE